MTDTIPRKQLPRMLGGGWFHSTELLDGEEVLREARVMHKPARSRQGGMLYLTDRRLVYLPDRWAVIVGDERVVWPLESVDDAGMTRADDASVLFRDGNLLVFECMYVQRSGERHLFSTGLPLTDREWLAAVKSAGGSTPAPVEPTEEAAEAPAGDAGESDD
jgi:hypothetical protein